MKCPQCGAENDAANRFCDQCGARLEEANAAAPATTAEPPVAVAITCPSCGSPALPGEAFCDECGAALGDVAPIAATAADEAPTAANPVDETVVVPTIETPAVEAPPSSNGVSAAPDLPTMVAPVNEQPAEPTEATAVAAAEAPAEPEPPAAPAIDEAQRQALEQEIARQQQIIAQFEQMQATFGAATPPVVAQGLDQARAALATSQAELDALVAPPPVVDPAEVKRLEEEIARQQQIIAQFEQMQATFGAATPAVVVQGLAEAHAALDQSQAQLSALGGTAPAAPAEAAQASTPPGTAPFSSPDDATVVAPAPVTGPRLVFEDDRELPLPANVSEITIGREDPISGIHPEIDLTPFGGEGGGVSRQHARLNYSGGVWTLSDLNSTNYTRVDGNRIEANVAIPVRDGMRLQFGRIAVTFKE